MTKEEYKDIAPFDDGEELQQKMQQMVADPAFQRAVGYVVPDMDFQQLGRQLAPLTTKDEFQRAVMFEILKMLEAKTTAGVTASGLENLGSGRHRLFISNHRDIVLDAAFLGLIMLRHGVPAMEVALGDNLLIYEWIENLVRINKGIIVKRNQRMTKALESAKQLSAYIHYCILEKNQSVWLAQREGRAKDSNDVTQESVIKMLGLMGPGECIAERLACLDITPVSITYEYDPNDYLKASEFLARQRDPEFKKSQRDDLLAMETGMLRQKGQVHFAIGRSLHKELQDMTCEADKSQVVKLACSLIDSEIHLGYHIFTINYIAYDEFNSTNRFADRYNREEKADFDAYLNIQLDKVELPDVTPEERDFMRRAILKMYANPLTNKLAALEARK